VIRSKVKSPFQLFTGIDVTDADASGQEEVNWCNYERDDGDHQRGGSPEGLFRVSWKYQPTHYRPPKMTPRRAKMTMRDQRSLFVVGA